MKESQDGSKDGIKDVHKERLRDIIFLALAQSTCDWTLRERHFPTLHLLKLTSLREKPHKHFRVEEKCSSSSYQARLINGLKENEEKMRKMFFSIAKRR